MLLESININVSKVVKILKSQYKMCCMYIQRGLIRIRSKNTIFKSMSVLEKRVVRIVGGSHGLCEGSRHVNSRPPTPGIARAGQT